MVAQAFHTSPRNATKSLRSIGFGIEHKNIIYYQRRGEQWVMKRKTVRAYVVPDERTWLQMVQRYYYAEEGVPEPEIPECLMSAHYVPSSMRQTLDEYM